MTTFSQNEEKKLLNILRKNPQLKQSILEMVDIVGEDLGGIEYADDAEEVIVNNIKKTGKELLTSWAQKRENKIAEETKKERNIRSHEKKTSNGTLL